MTHIKSTLLFLLFAFINQLVFAQVNPSIAILPVNDGGVVAVGATMDVKVTITNTGTGNVVAFKLRPNITMPPIVTILPTAEQTGLPPNWSVVTNTGNGQIRICNGTDIIAGGESRDIFIKVQGAINGGPSQCEAQINFGGANCGVTGPQPSGNNGIDDFATSSVTVAGTVPLNLVSFNAGLLNCQPSLYWTTSAEINSNRFEIERNEDGQWTTIGTVAAKGTASSNTHYNFADRLLNSNTDKVLYRLKMIDHNGSFKYSDVLPVLVDCNNIQVLAYPNPVQDGKLYISITGTSGKTEGLLMSASGQVVSKKQLSNGTNAMEVQGITSGTYILDISNSRGFNQKIKIIIHQ